MIGTFPLPETITVGTVCPKLDCQSNDPQGKCYFSDCTKHPDGCPLCAKKYGPCTGSVITTPLEAYVQYGLQQEWLKEWFPPYDALEAGAVAYRTFGTYFIEHPGHSGLSSYDIRDDTCNQKYVDIKNPAHDTYAAATRTIGIAMSQDGVNAYNSEYSRNTNHQPPDPNHDPPKWPGCMDGYSGNGAGWPCMQDPIAAGTTHAGHGRGMSQQGSWWWARGQSYQGQTTPAPGWQCILDHYYNDNGNSTGAGGQFTYRYSFLYGPGGDGQIVFAPTSIIPSRRDVRNPADLCEGSWPSDIFTMQLDGSNLAQITQNQCYGRPVWSPTQTQISFTALPFLVNIMSATGGLPTYLGYGFDPDWSRENVIAFNNLSGLYRVNPDGSGAFQINLDQNAGDAFWSPDGNTIVYDTCSAPGCDSIQIALMNANGTGQPIFLTSGSNNTEPAWSPDGKNTVFISDRSGSGEIWVMNSDGSGNPVQKTFSSPYPVAFPRWSQDGQYIVWLTVIGDGTARLNMMNASGGVPVTYGPTLQGGAGPSMDTTRCRKFDAL